LVDAVTGAPAEYMERRCSHVDPAGPEDRTWLATGEWIEGTVNMCLHHQPRPGAYSGTYHYSPMVNTRRGPHEVDVTAPPIELRLQD